jgi:hypothetical protein
MTKRICQLNCPDPNKCPYLLRLGGSWHHRNPPRAMQTPLTFSLAQVCQPSMCTPNGSILEIVVHYFMVGSRTEDAKSDIILGARFLIGASSGLCPRTSGHNCGVHFAVGSIIVVCACVDLFTEVAWFQFFQKWFAPEFMRTATIRAHAAMFICEFGIFICALYALLSGMTAYEEEARARRSSDADSVVFVGAWSYCVMCCISTCLSMLFIFLMVAIPRSVWERLSDWGMKKLADKMWTRMSTKICPTRLSAAGDLDRVSSCVVRNDLGGTMVAQARSGHSDVLMVTCT